ncbi:hypothetical protein BCM02_11057 [Paenibacillus methanolicus]|uniref:Uncharacterized protein n=1 Tax=Paenibacillus methanolicus TaxID=582686 RepID=A0A5S5BXQ0_9BACL|nr:hypothetical protein BCM02_11057 [Paenibacillus methanolicus]
MAKQQGHGKQNTTSRDSKSGNSKPNNSDE